MGNNLIYFGAPGTGKSYTLDKNLTQFTAYERVTFHQNYSYAQFVGCYKPVMIEKPAIPKEEQSLIQFVSSLSYDDLSAEVFQNIQKLSGDNQQNNTLALIGMVIGSQNSAQSVYEKLGLEKPENYKSGFQEVRNIRKYIQFKQENPDSDLAYKYIPGPFIRMLVKALKNPNKNFCLVIEEINRANAAAVFGDVFQLLDRKDGESEDSGVSEYSIDLSEDLKMFLNSDSEGLNEAGKKKARKLCDLCKDSEITKIKIPDNLSIWATMNSADQGVQPMDTAFKRRWDFEYIGIDAGAQNVSKQWDDVRRQINQLLLENRINEDKLMGPFFLKTNPSTDFSSHEFKKQFQNKVLMYLFEDAARFHREKIFADGKIATLSSLFSSFDASVNGLGVFKTLENGSEVEALF
jgi:hypothetical protein